MEANFQNSPDVGSVLNTLLSNPSALSSIMSVLGGVMNGQQKPPPAQSEDTAAFSHNDSPLPVHSPPPPNFQADSTPASFLAPKAPLFSQESKEKTLLLAIKPFLSKNKCDTLDLFIKLLDIISLVGRIR